MLHGLYCLDGRFGIGSLGIIIIGYTVQYSCKLDSMLDTLELTKDFSESFDVNAHA